MHRKPVVAGRFYPDIKEQCINELKECLEKERLTQKIEGKISGGIVPHAGWVYSGSTAGLVFQAIKEGHTSPVFVIFGAVHVYGVPGPAIFAEGSWETPLGEIEIHQDLSEEIIKEGKGFIVEDISPHRKEHSIEVQLPFIKYLFPESKIVTIMVPPDKNALAVGEIVGKILSNYKEDCVVVGSTDLTHYGMHYGQMDKGVGKDALHWVKNVNDKRLVDLIIALKAEDVVSEADSHGSACGAGAITATIAAVRLLGAKEGKLLKYTTSYDEIPSFGDPSSFVGYSAVVFTG
ncbi:MAG TPA: AmmeMemoRadiSam system protein B [Candidatus Eremiobacteraeota bacterium]|nr:MAG: hypothetical protein BWY64_02875 [bacterium ADurb.Bin363]HPZ10366.1 AmmeMemoRadiSam system protein B [Candidatus Eremiobacteraeota bacterium]